MEMTETMNIEKTQMPKKVDRSLIEGIVPDEYKKYLKLKALEDHEHDDEEHCHTEHKEAERSKWMNLLLPKN